MSMCSFFLTQLNSFKYFYLNWIILLTIKNFFHTVKWFQVLLCNNSTSVICLNTFKWIYIYTWFVSEQFVGNFIFKLELICLHTSIDSVFIQLNGFNYCYLTLLILFNINRLFVDSEVVKSISI